MPTITTSFLCNNCGAPLQVQASTKFCTCSFCGSHLKLRQEGGTVFCEVLGELKARTERIEDDVRRIRLNQELEALDREWEQEEEQFSTRQKDGSYVLPSKSDALLKGAVAAVAGVVWMGFASNTGAPVYVPLLGLFVIGMGIHLGIQGMQKADQFEKRKHIYQQRRARLLREIDQI